MSDPHEHISLYFFDVDDNILFLGTKIFIRNTVTGEEVPLSTEEYAATHPHLGRPGRWEDFREFDGSFRQFRDISADQLRPGQRQYFVEDVEKAVGSGGTAWQGPSWPMFVHACQTQRPVSIVTARGHSPDTLRAGIRLLADRGLIAREPNYLAIFPVTNGEVRKTQLDDPNIDMTTPALKKRAILKTVEQAIHKWGGTSDLRFGMSDDDPKNVELIIRAMIECKKKYPGKRFYVINTHRGEEVKLEVFPYDSAANTDP